MIISRYLTKEILLTLMAVTTVLLLLFLSNQLVHYLSFAASGKIAANILFELMGLEVPYLLSLLLPLGLYLGIILAYGRLYADSEMNVLHACGVSVNRLIMMTSLFAFCVSLVVLVLMLWVNPYIASQKDQLIRSNLAENNLLNTLMPGRFQVSNDGKRVIYVEKISNDRKQAQNIFIADQKGGSPVSAWVVVSAAKGYQKIDPANHGRFVVGEEGYRYEGRPGENDYKIIRFEKYTVRIPEAIKLAKRQQNEAASNGVLWENYQNAEKAAELQWRFSIPLSGFILGLLAIPFSQVRPRQGRYSRVLPAIILCVAYFNLLFAARIWVEQKTIPVKMGIWWVHGIFLVILLIVLMRKRQSL